METPPSVVSDVKSSNIAGMKFAPLDVPMNRRLQTAAVAVWFSVVPVSLLVFVYMLYRTSLLPLALAYIVFIALDTAPEAGGRKSMMFRSLPFWKWFAEFFPIQLVKTVDLDPAKSYVFGYHPHGILSLGAFLNFGSEANNVSSVFKGIDLRLLTINANLNMPFFRDIIMFLGLCSVSRRSCEYILKKGPGNGIVIVVGGAAEALNAFPGTMDLVIKNRFGFVKLALRNGSSLVPVISFGENDVWDQVPNPKGSWLRHCQVVFQRYASFSPPVFHGRGIFTYNFGVLPYRHPIVSVVGAPIDCPRIETPSNEDVQKYHQMYMDALVKLYDDHKDLYAPDRVKEIQLIEAEQP